MSRATKVSFVNVGDVLEDMGFSWDEQEQILNLGFSNVSHGDAAFTLIGNRFALRCILDGCVGLSVPEAAEVCSRYWELVGEDDYVNIEG